ncbi:MAG: hypothetical protein QM606_05815 [Leucobacter sp.]
MSRAHRRNPRMQAALRAYRPQIAATLPAPCVQPRCQLGGTVYPDQSWDVAHLPGLDAHLDPEHVPTRAEVGPGHSKCNRSDGGRVGAAKTNAARRAAKRMRSW